MARSTWVLGLTLLAAAVMPSSADAQNPQTRQGFFIGFGLGAGSFGCDGCDGRETSGTAHLEIGGTLNPQLLMAGELSGWTKEEGGGRLTHANASAILQFYPSVTSGFFVKGGIGYSTVEVEVSIGGGSFSASDEGFGATAGLGYDIRVGSNFSITPYGMFAFGAIEDISPTTFQGGLGVTFH